MISLSTTHAMEETEICPFDLLPDEITLNIFSYLVPACEDQNQALQTFKNLQLVSKYWFTLINDKPFTQGIIEEMFKKFIISELNFYALLQVTQQSRTLYKQSLHALKTVAQYAVLHHNDLHKETESGEFPWMNLTIGCYSNAMRKSYKHLLSECAQEGTDFTKLSEAIAHEYDTIKTAIEPQEVINHYPPGWDPYRITAELFYCVEHTEQLLSGILTSQPYLTEKIVQYKAMIAPFDFNLIIRIYGNLRI